MSISRMLLLHAVTPLHVGTGRGEGIIDLPIARDRVTQHPILPGSGIKGPLRAACDSERRTQVFGPETDNASAHSSAVRFSDARLVAMPCPSDFGTFAWVTSPLVLRRWVRDASRIVSFPGDVPDVTDETCACSANAAIRSRRGTVALDGQSYRAVALEGWAAWLAELVFPGDPSWQALFRERLAVVSDESFDTLARNGTDVRAHIRIDPGTGTVSDRALWYEESVPAEAVFASVLHCAGGRVAPEEALRVVEQTLAEPVVFGGGKTTGMGLMRGHLHGGSA